MNKYRKAEKGRRGAGKGMRTILEVEFTAAFFALLILLWLGLVIGVRLLAGLTGPQLLMVVIPVGVVIFVVLVHSVWRAMCRLESE